jgi:hypothetical protein
VGNQSYLTNHGGGKKIDFLEEDMVWLSKQHFQMPIPWKMLDYE